MRVGDYEIGLRAFVIVAVVVLAGCAAVLLTRDPTPPAAQPSAVDTVPSPSVTESTPPSTTAPSATSTAPSAPPANPTPAPETAPTGPFLTPPAIPTGDPKIVVRVGAVSYREPDVVAMMKTIKQDLPAQGSDEYKQLRSMAAALLVRDEVLRRGAAALRVPLPTATEIEERFGAAADKATARRLLLTGVVSARLAPDGDQAERAAAFERWLAELALEYDAQVYLGD